jgi:hypothetical protein
MRCLVQPIMIGCDAAPARPFAARRVYERAAPFTSPGAARRHAPAA